MEKNKMVIEKTMNNKVVENKKENKKASKGFIFIMIASMLFGGIVGGLSTFLKEGFLEDENSNVIIGDFFMNVLGVASPFVMGIVGVIGFSISIFLYKKRVE